MQAQAAKKAKAAAPAQRAAPAEALAIAPLPTSEVYLQRRSCACGGSCPRCQPAPRRIQPKLIVGPPGDAFEQEADRIATRVMRLPDRDAPVGDLAGVDTTVQRACKACEPEKRSAAELVQRAAAPPDAVTAPAEDDARPISATELTSGGQTLNASTRGFFEARFGRDLSAVRWHSGPQANAYCARLNAHAFTYGHHIWLGNGASPTPSFVIAHELAHVVQQTQPRALTENAANNASSQRAAPRAVQRLPFWVPVDPDKPDKIMSGGKLHKLLLGKIEGKNKITTEAPVPNAIRGEWGLGLQGFADLYRASSRVGVFFNPRNGLSRGDKHGSERFLFPAKPDRAGKSAQPVVTKKGIEGIKAGPKDIELGELKPAVLGELTKGNTQLDNYKEGFQDAAKLTNEWAANQKKTDRWDMQSVTRLPDKDVPIPADHDPSAPASAMSFNLAVADIGDTKSVGKNKETVKYSVKMLYLPKTYLGEVIPGKLFLEPFGQGLWMYYARPDDFGRALDVPRFKRDERGAYMTVASAVQAEVIGNLTRGPEQIKLLARGRLPLPPPVKLTRTPARIFRKPKQTKLKDHFDAKAYEKWSKRQTALGNEVRGKDKTKTTAKTFKKLEFLEAAAKAEDAIAPGAKAKTKNFPTATELKDQIAATGTGATKTKAKDISLEKLFGWLERWTSVPYKALGKFRQLFGGGFVTAVNKLSAIKDNISKKVQEFFGKRTKAKKTAALLVKALGRALKQVVELIVPQTVSLVVEAIGNGIQKKIDALFEDTFVEASIDKFEAWSEQIKNYATEAEAKVKKLQEDFLKKFDWIDDIIDEVKWFWRIVKAGRVLLKCRKPPLLGCLALLKDAAKDDELQCILCIPWVQQQIAKRVLDVKWFADMPVELAGLIMKTLHDAVPEKADVLRDIFSEKIAASAINVEDLVPECDAKCSGFGLFGGAEVTPGEAETAEKMSEFAENLSQEQLEELLKEAERRGMLDKPFDQKQAEDMLKELEEKKAKEAEKGTPPPQEGELPKEPAPQEKGEAKPPPQPKPTPEQKKADESQKAQPEPKKEAAPPTEPKPTPKPTPPPKAAKKPPKKPKETKGGEGAAGGKAAGKGGGAGGKCVWDPSMIRIAAYVLEPLDEAGSTNTLAYGDNEMPFPTNPIPVKCAARFRIKNDFGFGWCERVGKFSAPAVTTEVTFNGKQLFKQTDTKPKVWSAFYIEPKWGDRFDLPLLTEKGELRIKLTIFDPDTGTTVVFDDKVAVDILTKGLCCNCIS